MPSCRRPLVLLLGFVVAAAALVVVAPRAGGDGDEGRAGRGAVVTEVGGVVDVARTAGERAPARTLLLLAVLGVALGAAAPRLWAPALVRGSAHWPRPALLRAAACRAPPPSSRITAR